MESSSKAARPDDGDDQISGDHASSPGNRMLSLIGKLDHPIPEIRLRAIRNLRLKITSEHLAPPERFFEEQHELYTSLKSLITSNHPHDDLLRMETLLFIAEGCKKIGPGFRRR